MIMSMKGNIREEMQKTKSLMQQKFENAKRGELIKLVILVSVILGLTITAFYMIFSAPSSEEIQQNQYYIAKGIQSIIDTTTK